MKNNKIIKEKGDYLTDPEEPEDIVIPTVLPLLPVRDVVIFTNMILPLFVGRERTVLATEEAVRSYDGFIFLVSQKDPHIDDPETDNIYKIGTVGKILRMLKLPDGRIKVMVQGVVKAKLIKYLRKKAYYRVKVDLIEEKPRSKLSLKTQALMRNVQEQSSKILELRDELTGEISSILNAIDDPGKLADLVASNIGLKPEESQQILEQIDSVKRLEQVNEYLTREVELSCVQAKINTDVQNEIDKGQRDLYLREHLRAINKELGEIDDRALEVEEFLKKLKKAKVSKEAEKEAKKQLKRFEQMQADSSEAVIIRAYLDWIIDLPWNKSTKDFFDIAYAEGVLNKEHYGLEKVKTRILEYLSVRQLNSKAKGPILCFVGPPGVGKTSLGRAIAKAIKRKFVRISLGGVNDEAEIRGHRRTYVGALPGRILQGLRKVEKNNPVFMIDEIDKMCSDFRGDPSAALLEVLDTEQNSAFCDNYLSLEFDISKVMFIMTANSSDPIPSALLDRMELINIAGYTVEEKELIAKQYLLVRQIKENGLGRRKISITDNALKQIISDYTFEAGVRNLERELEKICRKIARKIAEKNKGPFKISKTNLHKYLGPPQYLPEMELDKDEIGIATGLAWTQSGGETLYIEATLVKGKGDLIITGQLGEVMQESANIALTFSRSKLNKKSKKRDILDNQDIHIHVPSGAIPKDGPSAGITLSTACISLFTNCPVSKDVAMTGEISLRGRVLAVGGLKEKLLGALRAGIKTVIIPQKNKKDLLDIAQKIKNQLNIRMVKDMDEVLEIALVKDVKKGG